ncbi:MAG: metal ABC transporter ATP-binding protein [Dehalococcoidia bacterium]|nr:metal ABC transporter ATP-binding protein [Dehalococcoidia bacterium]
MDPSPGALQVTGLSTGYGTTFHLANVAFRAEPGDVVGLIGPNGGGKSTLLKTIAGVLTPRAGTIELGGVPLRRLAARVAFVPQREEVNWDFPVTARDVVLMGRYRSAGWLRRPGRADRDHAEQALARLGLAGLGHRHISSFSGGQQQRIFLARALVQDPLVVLLDEPFTGIDAANREVFHEAIRDFAASGAVVLMATHDLDEVQVTTSKIACVSGRLVAYGPTAETWTPEILRATFGGRVAVFA